MSSAVEVPSIHPPKISGDQRQLSSLSPITEERLLQFNGRTRTQTVLRALGWIVSALVALLLIAVVVDATVYHSSTRWWLAGALIGSTLVGIIAFCVRPFLRRPHWSSLASNMEKLCPELRNQLLSAVELARQPLVNDSVAFRHQVQRSAAIAVGPVDVATLLPSRLIRKPLLVGFASTLAVVLLCFVPQLKMPQRLLRVLLPWANIGRITFVSIHIDSPDVYGDSSKLIFPRGEMTGVVARVEGPKPRHVFLEWRLPNGSTPTALEMSLVEGRTSDDKNTKSGQELHFETVFPIEAELLEFRVVASGAETAWFPLTTIPRPRVESFEITVTPPEYTQLPIRQFSGETADLAALEGSKVSVSLNTDPAAAELRGNVHWLSRSATSRPSQTEASAVSDLVPNQSLSIDSKQKLFVNFSADGDREFKFDLQHLTSGIKNDFSPTYRARVIKDLPPQIAWVWPTSSGVLVNQQELLGLKLVARDEFTVDKWIGRYRINSQDWVHVDLPSTTSTSTAPDVSDIPPRSDPGSKLQSTDVDWLFDLSKLQLQEGDIVEVQVSAKDRKQQETASSTLRVMISALQWDLKPSQLELERQRIKRELAQLAEKIKPIDKQIEEIRKSKDLASSDALQQLADHISQVDQLSRSNLAQLRESIERALREPQDRVTQHELRALGQWLEKIDNQNLPALEKLRETTSDKFKSTELAQANEDKLRGQLVFPLADTTRQTISEFTQMADGFQAVVDSDAARRISMQSNRLANWVKQLQAESKSESIPVEVLDRRREIVVQHIKQLSEALSQTGEFSGKQLENLARGIGQQVDQLISNVERSSPSFKDSATSIQQVMSNVRTQLSANMQQQANQGRRRATQLAGSSGERFNESLRALDNGSLQASAQTEKAAERLHDLRSLHTAGDTADRQFGADLGNAQRALSYSLTTSASTQEQAKEVRQVADAVKKLEAVHALEQANNSLNQLLVQEGQRQYLQENLIEHPRVWDDYAEQLERTVRLMREAQIPGEIVGKADQLQWNQAASQASEKINERMWSNEPPVSAKPQLLQLSQTIQELREQLDAIAKAARESLQQRTPTLGELAQNAAQSSAELVDQTEQLSEQLDENKVPDSTARLESLKKAVEPASKPLQDLKEALVDLAGSQDLLDSQQLQQAKKADAALDVVNKAEKQLNQSLESVKPADNAAQNANQKLAKDLEAAANKQTDVSAAMRNLAEYFDKDATDRTDASSDSIANDSSKETAEPSDEQRLEDIAKSLNEGSTSDNTEADSEESSVYEQAQRLSQIAGLTPEQMLKSLEKQLKSSPPMQAEMSEIASDAAEQALRQLDRSQKRQEAMSTQLEQSDPRTRNQKVLMAHDLTSARNEAGNLLQQLLQEANGAAAAGQAKDSSSKLQETAQKLRETLSQVPHVGAHNSVAQLQDAARKIGDALDQAHQQTTEIEASLTAAATDAVANQNGQQKDQQLRDAKSRRDRMKSSVERQADQFKQNFQNLAKSAEDQKRQTEQDVKQRREQLSRTEKDLQKQPENASLKDSVARQKRELAMSEARVEASREFKEAIETRKKSAEEFAEQVKKNAAPEINQPNPQSQLAQSLAQQAANVSKQFAGQLDQWEQWASSPEAAEQELASQASQEANVQRQVQSAAQDLARASRHESRLNHSANSAELNELATSTQDVANQSLQQSRDQLSKALDSARSQDRPTGQATSSETAASISAIQNADKEIRKAADEVRELLDSKSNQSASESGRESSSSESAANSSNSNSPTSSPGSSTPNAPFTPEQMAQMLDELDRQLNDQGQQQGGSQQQGSQGQQQGQQQGQSQQGQSLGSSASASPSSGQSGSGQTGSTKLPTTLSQAAQELAGQLSRQRQAASDWQNQSSNSSPSSSSRQSASVGKSSSSPTSTSSTSSGAFAQSVPSESVRVLSVPRTNDAWGELRKQEATETVETQREKGSNRYRRAIDAYFKALAESKSVSGGGSNDDSKK